MSALQNVKDMGSLLDHVGDDTIGLPWSSVIGRRTVPKHLQGGVTADTVLVTKGLVLGTVDLVVSILRL
jgi:hypothetical protein